MKLVTESLSDFLSEATKLDPTLGGKIDKDTHKLLSKDQNKDDHELDHYAEEITESEEAGVTEDQEEDKFTPEQKKAIEDFIDNYQGEFEDDDIHELADELGVNVHEMEEYIYNMARDKGNEEPAEDETSPEEGSTKKGFHDDIQEDTLENENYRKVLYTGKNLQLVLMTLKPGENIGLEHHEADQFFRFEEGVGQCIINDEEYDVKDGDSVFVPGGAEHDIINTSDTEDLQLYTLYGPPNHKDGTIYQTKEAGEEAEKNGEDEFDGTTE
jgi:mannose-6-phosphate isomerase-like protein (cupin superfamily)